MMTVDDVWKAVDAAREIVLGACGGLVAYLFDYSKAKREGNDAFVFRPSSMLINMVLGMFVAYNVGTLVPLDTIGRDAIIGLSGVSAYQILLLAESRLAKWLLDRLPGMGNERKGE